MQYSWKTGFVKPDERCFSSILEREQLAPEHCFYFDDSEKNVVVAKRLGLRAYVFENGKQVRRLLRDEKQ